eukprot:XP_024997467.1 transmembrane protein 107 isoform X1 [Gallus gallus]
MAPLGMLVPARFLTMTAHLVALLTVAMARDPHVRATLPLQFSQEEYTNADAQLLWVVGSALGLMAIEVGGFFSGVSMFHPGQGLLSTLLPPSRWAWPYWSNGTSAPSPSPHPLQRPPGCHRGAADGDHVGTEEEVAVTSFWGGGGVNFIGGGLL